MKKKLSSTHRDLCDEWNYEKNDGLIPEHVTHGSQKKVWWKCDKGHSWQSTIANRVLGNKCPYCSGKVPIEGQTDLKTLNPGLASEWDYKKNTDLSPKDVTLHSGKYAYWKCENDHSWYASINSRSRGAGCPYCSGHKAILGETDLKTVNPTVANQWNQEKNGILIPENYTPNSNIRVWWKCDYGHEWIASIQNRTNGNGCPYCAGKLPVVGKNDLGTLNPSILSEWNYNKNKTLMPQDVTLYSGKRIWWKCAKGHEWQATICDRTSHNETGCPYCAGNLPIVGETDLATKYPHLVSEWDYEKNNGLLPQNVTSRSIKKVYWKCNKGHNYKTSILNRTLAENSCPYCNKRIATKTNSIEVLYPKLAEEWNYEKNHPLLPSHVTKGSTKTIWWRCKEGHEWTASPNNRTRGTNCPYCVGKSPIKGKTDLKTLNPKLAEEWNYEKNRNLTPEDVTSKSEKKVWWKCDKGHSWRASIYTRNHNNTGCPYCYRRS